MTETLTAEQVAEYRRLIQGQITTARSRWMSAALGAKTPAAGRSLVTHASHLSHLLLDDWQLSLVEEMVDHDTGRHESGCSSELCEMNGDEMTEMADRWALAWPTLAAWLRERAAVR